MVLLKNYLEQADNRGRSSSVFMVVLRASVLQAREAQGKALRRIKHGQIIENVKNGGWMMCTGLLMDGPYARWQKRDFWSCRNCIDEHFYFAQKFLCWTKLVLTTND